MYDTRRYLRQIEVLDLKIQQKKQHLADKRLRATAGGAIRYDKPDVISSLRTDTLEIDAIEIVELENEIKADIAKYEVLKNRIINEIHQLEDPRYIDILHKRYVEYKKDWYEIAEEMNYSYDHTKHLATQATLAFEKIRRKNQ